jgi:hypothetical protein
MGNYGMTDQGQTIRVDIADHREQLSSLLFTYVNSLEDYSLVS